jgi:hypothetical protein
VSADERVPKYFRTDAGTSIGLHASRWDERHRRSRVVLPKCATAWDYAPLIDMVRPALHLNEFRYLGMSALEWLDSLRKKNSPNYACAVAWFEARIAQVRRKLDQRPRVPSACYCVELAPIPTQPTLPAMIAQLGLRRASAAQWLSTLSGFTSKGVREEELRHSTLLTILERADPDFRLPAHRIQRFISLEHLRPKLVIECAHGFISQAGWRECCERVRLPRKRRRGAVGNGRDELQIIRYRHRTFGWSLLRRTRFADLLGDRQDHWLILDERGKPVLSARAAEFNDVHQAMDAAESHMARRFRAWHRSQDTPRWQDYSLAGGSRYREVLVQLDDWPFSYQSRHYGTRNVLVHLRTSVHEVPGGRRVLYLDEAQSDWHADLHFQSRGDTSRRPKAPVPPAPFGKEWPLLAMKLMLWWAQRQGLDGLAWSTAELQRRRWRGNGPPESLYKTELPEAARQLARVLPVEVTCVPISFRTGNRCVDLGIGGWAVYGDNGTPVTKPFRSREQAERFAELTGVNETVDVPVLLLHGLSPIGHVPLYGVGTLELWMGSARRSPVRSSPLPGTQ